MNHVGYVNRVADFILKRLCIILYAAVLGITAQFFSETNKVYRVVLRLFHT